MERRSFLKGLAASLVVLKMGIMDEAMALVPEYRSSEDNITEAQMKALVQEMWKKGGKPEFVHVGPYQKQVISGFTTVSPTQDAVAWGTITIAGSKE